MIQNIFNEFARFPQIEAMAIGGSRFTKLNDDKSDYDVYVYCKEMIPEENRRAILEKYCKRVEVGNRYWEYEDNCTMNNGVDLDIIYRQTEEFVEAVGKVVEEFQVRGGYTTCLWHNLLNCRIVYDKGGKLGAAQRRFGVPYPQQLRQNIIEHNMQLLKYGMPAHLTQLSKAILRRDLVSINYQLTAFLESYFDVVFALNEKQNPGKKRLLAICRKECKILPENLEENMEALFLNIYRDEGAISYINTMIFELEKVLEMAL